MTLKISVIIATHQRCSSLKRVLQELLSQTPPFDYEIIVVDNNSMDQTEEIVKSLMLTALLKLKYFKQTLKGKSNALNLGIARAQGEIIAFTDDDVHIDPHWLTAIEEGFRLYDADGIGGKVLPVFPGNTPAWVRDNPRQAAGVVVIYDQGQEAKPADSTIERFIGSNWAFKSKIFKECGMFNPDLGPGMPVMGEDEDFDARLRHMGKKLYYCPQMLIHHPVDLDRLSLKNAADWHLKLGRYQAYKQLHHQGEHFIYYFGVPRYILKNVMINFLKVLVFWENPLAFWNAYRNLFSSIGMFQEYRLFRMHNRSGHA